MIFGISLSWIHISDFTDCDLDQHLSSRSIDDYGDDISFGNSDVDFDQINQNGQGSDEDAEEEDFEPRIITDPALKPKVDPEANKKVNRPRYISTELGIREKLFTGIISSKSTINSLAVAVNKTLSTHLQKLIFYTEEMSEQEIENNPELMTVVPHKGTRSGQEDQVEILFKTLSDFYHKYQDIYDWFYIAYENTYTQPDRILNIVNHMSITRLLYMGVPLDTTIVSTIQGQDKENSNSREKTINSKYCQKEGGIIISRALLIELVPRMEDCKSIISSKDPDVWLGQCIISLTAGKIGCINHEEEQVYKSFDLRTSSHFSHHQNVDQIIEKENSKNFINAVTIFPVKNEQEIYKLHKKFCQIEIDNTYKKIEEIQEEIKKLASKTPDGEAGLSWPIGINPPFQPSQRWDIITWDYFTEDYSLSCPGEIPKCDLTPAEEEDVKIILKQAMGWVNEKYNKEGLYLYKKELENGYRRFDPQRGMDYILDIKMLASVTPFPEDFSIELYEQQLEQQQFGQHNNKKMIKNMPPVIELSHRLQLLKPLSHVEIIPMPYVTESTKVNILLPIQKNQRHLLADYLKLFDTNILTTKETQQAQLTIIFVYNSNDAKNLEKGNDCFSNGKELLNAIENKYPAEARQDGQKKIIPWMSVKTDNFNYIKIVDVISRTKRFPEDSLFFLNSVAVRITTEYLNRCRMNTINGYQVFFPIPFSSFNPDLIYDKTKAKGETGAPPENANLNIEIKATTGHFDIYSYDEVCFYHADYINARAKLKNDSDDDIYGMFIEKSDLHVFRAVEASLKRVWLLKNCKNLNSDGEMRRYLSRKVPASEKYCVRSNAEGLAPRAVLGSKIYPEPQ